ncbi:MAG: nucleotide exchange factor GrpE [Planctomycetaceae bacterium]|jgi:molecular chaperone GrpE (heat shock protein)|nr:nucleotide exchange factor GrpE [Planctomycetaceae bacterium]
MSDMLDKYRTSFDRLMEFSVGSELAKNDEITESVKFDEDEVENNNEETSSELLNVVQLENSDSDSFALGDSDESEIFDGASEVNEVEEEAIDSVEPIEQTITQLSRQNAEVLEQFTNWLYSSDDESCEVGDLSEENAVGSEIGLFQIFEALSAQRQELKLYVKSGRKTVELIEKSVEETSRVVEQFIRFKRERPDIERKAIKPFIMSLIEIDESLMRAVSFLDSVQSRLILHSRNIEIYAGAYCDQFSIWQRFWRRKIIFQFTEYLKKERVAEVEHVLQPLQDGFKMVLFRMDDVLRRHSITRLNPVGELVDPNTMQVVGILDSQEVKVGHVVDVVRPGYLWNGKPFRYADVRAARMPEH